MLNENLKKLRKEKGFSQEELAAKLNVVRQTISKWEKGLSVPDAQLLISLSEILETPVSVFLGETIESQERVSNSRTTITNQFPAFRKDTKKPAHMEHC